MVKKYNGENLKELDGFVLVDFYADWCGPCKMMEPILEGLDIDVLKINVDENEKIAQEYRVMSIPYMLFIKDGNIVKELIGFHSKNDLEEVINELK